MHVADSHMMSGNRSLDDFVAASSEHSDDDMVDNEDDDLRLANVNEDQVCPSLPVRRLKAYLCSFLATVLQACAYCLF